MSYSGLDVSIKALQFELTLCVPACPAASAKKHAKVKKEGGVAGVVGGGDGAEGEEGEENKVSHVAPAGSCACFAACLGLTRSSALHSPG